MGDYRKSEIIKASIAILIIIIAVFIVFTFGYKNLIEGERKMPFKLSKVTVVSTVEGEENKDKDEKWNLNIFQNNDVYFSIEKNEESDKEDIIQTVVIQNVKVEKSPKLGKIVTFMPNSSEGRLFNNSEETLVEEKLTYRGSSKSDSKTLEIANQGGTAVVRFSIADLGKYISNEDEEIRHDFSLLEKIGVNKEQVDFELSFDLVINLKEESYVTTIKLNLPCEGIEEKGTSSIELNDNFIFRKSKK
ncbi:MAG: hypothetical protein J6M60_06260 [Clostridia bacterium]|nr:hypothetical protein [Clostridia bacterium]